MQLEAQITKRIDSLLDAGQKLMAQRRHESNNELEFWVDDRLIPEVQAWMTSVANVVMLLAPQGSYFRDELVRITTNDRLKGGAPWALLQKMHGLLTSLKDAAVHGLLRKIEYIAIATAFDDFLDHAEAFHKGNKAREAGVLAAIVLEDTIKRIAAKNNIPTSGISLEQLIDELVKIGVFTPVKAKRIKGYAGVRNPALHAEWEEFDIKDAGDLIAGTRELIEGFL